MKSKVSLRRITIRGQLVLSILWFALNLPTAALFPIVVPTQILLFVTPGQVGNVQQVTSLAWLSALGAIITLFIPPLIGLLSDSTPGRLGRRRPYIIAGTLVMLFSVPIVIMANSIFLLILGISVMFLGLNIITAGYQGLIPDLVPNEQRGTASGFMGLMTILGNVGSLALAAWLFRSVNLQTMGATIIRSGSIFYYVTTIIVLLISAAITVIGVRETPLSSFNLEQAETRVAFQFHEWFIRNWFEPWHKYNFRMVFLTRAAIMMGLTLFMTFIEYYLANVAHVKNFVQATAVIAILALLGAVFSALVLGIFSDYVKRAPLVSLSTSFMALAAFAFVVFPSSFPLWSLGILFGLGYGGYMSVDWALSVDVLPSMETVGKDLGLWSASANLPTVIAPLLGSLIIILVQALVHGSGTTVLGYRLIFAAAALFLVCAAIGMLFVREQENHLAPAWEQPRTHIGWRLAFKTQAGKARGFLRFWPFWERLTRSIGHTLPIPDAPHRLLEVCFTCYTGQEIDLPDGVHVGKGDPVIELHFRNRAFLEVEDDHAWTYIRLIAQNLHALALWMQDPSCPGNGCAIYGTTLLYRGAVRLGFMVRERPKNLHAYLERFFMMGLLVLYHRNGRARLLQGTTHGTYPQEVWMSREKLLRRYGNSRTLFRG